MYLYNITYLVPHSLVEKWLQWMKEEHIPEILATALFTEHRIMQLLDQDESDGISFSVQFYTRSAMEYNKYITDVAPTLRAKANSKWGNQIVGFRTVMKTVQ